MYCINQICAWKGTSASDCNLEFDRWKGEHCLRKSGIECPSSQNVSPSPASGSGSSGGSSGSESTSDKNTNPPSTSGSGSNSGSESTSNCDTQCSQSDLSKVSTCMEAVERPPPPTSSSSDSSDSSDSGGSSSCSYTASEARACWDLVRYDSDNSNCDKPGAGGSLKSCWDRSGNWGFDCSEFTSCGVCCSSSRRLATSDDNLCKYYQELSACYVSCMCDDQECGSGSSHFESLRNAMDNSLSSSSESCPMKCGQKTSLYSSSVVKTVSPLLNIMLCLLVLLSFYNM